MHPSGDCMRRGGLSVCVRMCVRMRMGVWLHGRGVARGVRIPGRSPDARATPTPSAMPSLRRRPSPPPAAASARRLVTLQVLYVHCSTGHGRTGTVCALILGVVYHLSGPHALHLFQAIHDIGSTAFRRSCLIELGKAAEHANPSPASPNSHLSPASPSSRRDRAEAFTWLEHADCADCHAFSDEQRRQVLRLLAPRPRESLFSAAKEARLDEVQAARRVPSGQRGLNVHRDLHDHTSETE